MEHARPEPCPERKWKMKYEKPEFLTSCTLADTLAVVMLEEKAPM